MFNVEANGIAIGRFPLPPRPSHPKGEKIRQIIERPVLWGDSGRNLFWMELTEAEEEVPMIWASQSEEEARTIFTIFNLAERFISPPDPYEEDEDEINEDEPTLSARGPRRFVLLAADPPELRSLAVSGSQLEEISGPIGSVGQTKSRKLANPKAARKALEQRASALRGQGFVEIVPLETQIVSAFPSARVEGDPGYWSRTESWEKIRDLLIPLNPSLVGYVPPDLTKEIEAFEAEWEFRLPPSFKAFLRVFGPGHARGNFFFIFGPGGSWKHTIATLTEGVRENIKYMGYDFVTEEHARLEPISRMIFFCEDGGGNHFGWDPDDLRDPEAGEYAILEWPHGWDYVERIASSFPDFFLNGLLQDARNRLGGFAEPTFEPTKPDKQ